VRVLFPVLAAGQGLIAALAVATATDSSMPLSARLVAAGVCGVCLTGVAVFLAADLVFDRRSRPAAELPVDVVDPSSLVEG
jgi:hypothetical protein